jgi:hypothetical protein
MESSDGVTGSVTHIPSSNFRAEGARAPREPATATGPRGHPHPCFRRLGTPGQLGSANAGAASHES